MGLHLSFKSNKHVYTACIIVYISGSASDSLQSTEPSIPAFVHHHVAGAESQPGGEGDVAGSSKSLPAASSGRHPGRKRKTAKKRAHEILVSTSDEEADTVKDCFWRNLDEGLLPEDLCVPDMYSRVGYVNCLEGCICIMLYLLVY